MVDHDSLKTASLYINNQLLSRGLLRDGQTIDFARPGKSGSDVSVTMGKVIAVVNDLILRRDRDAEHRESLATTIRTLRAETLRQTSDIGRLTDQNLQTQRKLDVAEASENSLRSQLKTSESTIRGLKDDGVKARAMVAQARAACATETRRRERQIEALKKQLGEAGRARGSARNQAIMTITVSPGESHGGEVGKKGELSSRGSTLDDGYDLRSETNEFLAELARGLSEENSELLSLLRRTMEKLQDISGWEGGNARPGGNVTVLKPSPQDLANDLESIVEHLRTILTNPSFVPIEEVVVRDDEIGRLRQGWVKMESRWKEAVHLIDGWRRRMAASGRPVNDEELKMGLRLSPVRVRDVAETSHGLDLQLPPVNEEEEGEEGGDPVAAAAAESPSPAESLHLVPAQGHADQVEYEEDDDSASESDLFLEEAGAEVEIEDIDVDEPNVQILQQSTALTESLPLPQPPQMRRPLEDTKSGGNRAASTKEPKEPRRRPGDFTTIIEENTLDLAMEAGLQKAKEEKTRALREAKSGLFRKDGLDKENAKQKASPSAFAPNDSTDSIDLVKPTLSEFPTSKATTKVSKPTKEDRPAPHQESLDSATSKGSCEADPPAAETTTTQRSPRKISSRLPLPRQANPAPQQSPLTMATIAAKLAASEREADAARVRAKLKAARGGSATAGLKKRPSLGPVQMSAAASDMRDDAVKVVEAQAVEAETKEDEAGDPVKKDRSVDEKIEKPRKRERRASKAATRRRSTLSPWELESLISGGAGIASPAK